MRTSSSLRRVVKPERPRAENLKRVSKTSARGAPRWVWARPVDEFEVYTPRERRAAKKVGPKGIVAAPLYRFWCGSVVRAAGVALIPLCPTWVFIRQSRVMLRRSKVSRSPWLAGIGTVRDRRRGARNVSARVRA